jgi:hypothetical protein
VPFKSGSSHIQMTIEPVVVGENHGGDRIARPGKSMLGDQSGQRE